MHSILHAVILLAQQDRFDRGLAMFQWGLTMAGAGILVVALGILFSKPKKDAKDTSPAVKFLAATIAGAVGLGVIAYAWLGF